MTEAIDPALHRTVLDDGIERFCSELDDEICVDFFRAQGETGLNWLFECVSSQIDADDEMVATYATRIILRSRLPGRVDAITKILRLPFRSSGVRDEVMGVIFERTLSDPAFLEHAELVVESRRATSNSGWVQEGIDRFVSRTTPPSIPGFNAEQDR